MPGHGQGLPSESVRKEAVVQLLPHQNKAFFSTQSYQYPLCKAVLHVIDHVKHLSMICPTCNTWGSMGGQKEDNNL